MILWKNRWDLHRDKYQIVKTTPWWLMKPLIPFYNKSNLWNAVLKHTESMRVRTMPHATSIVASAMNNWKFVRIKVYCWVVLQLLYICANTHFDLEELMIVYIVYKLIIVYKNTNSLMTKWSISGVSLLQSGKNLRFFIALVSLEVGWVVRANMDSQWNVLKCMSSIWFGERCLFAANVRPALDNGCRKLTPSNEISLFRANTVLWIPNIPKCTRHVVFSFANLKRDLGN